MACIKVLNLVSTGIIGKKGDRPSRSRHRDAGITDHIPAEPGNLPDEAYCVYGFGLYTSGQKPREMAAEWKTDIKRAGILFCISLEIK